MYKYFFAEKKKSLLNVVNINVKFELLLVYRGGEKKWCLILLGAGVLCDCFGALRDGVLGQLTRQE